MDETAKALFESISNQIKTLHEDNTHEHKRLNDHFDGIYNRIGSLENWRSYIIGAISVITLMGSFILSVIVYAIMR